jgi:hypothetical protein
MEGEDTAITGKLFIAAHTLVFELYLKGIRKHYYVAGHFRV